MRPDDLRGGGHERDEAEVFSDAGHFLEHLVKPFGGVLLAKLVLHVGEHPSRHLSSQDSGVDPTQRALELRVFPADVPEVRGDVLK